MSCMIEKKAAGRTDSTSRRMRDRRKLRRAMMRIRREQHQAQVGEELEGQEQE